MADLLDHLPVPSPAPENRVLYVFKAAWDIVHNVAFAGFVIGAVILSEYCWKCFCGHGPTHHDRDWPRACRKCGCKSLAR